MATSTFTIPVGFVPDILSTASATLSQLTPFAALIIGVLLAIVALGALIGFLHK